jgi:hypothetical protein
MRVHSPKERRALKQFSGVGDPFGRTMYATVAAGVVRLRFRSTY